MLTCGGPLSGEPSNLYEAEGWRRTEPLELRLGPDMILDPWVYVSPALDDG